MQQQISERGNLETEYFEKDEHDKGTDFVQKRIQNLVRPQNPNHSGSEPQSALEDQKLYNSCSEDQNVKNQQNFDG